MAIDNTPPRLKLIVTIAVITVITLVSLDFVFRSYYATMTEEAAREKTAPTTDKDEQRKAEMASLTGAQLDQAKVTLAKGGRPEAITPQPSEDTGAMTGWSKLPKPLPAPTPAAAPAAVVPDAGATPTAAGDAGAVHAADAGATRPDGGHARPTPKRDAGAQ
jgi:hypothetical protein